MSAARTLRLTLSSVSPNSVRRSEWPIRTHPRAGFAHHPGADLAGERALAFPVDVLRGDPDRRPVQRRRHRVERRRGGRDDDVHAGDVAHAIARAPVTNVTDSRTVLNIFQLPAMSG